MKKNVTLINLKPPYNLQPSVLKLASPHRTESVIQLLIYESSISIVNLETEQSESMPIEASAFETIFNASHTVIIPEAMFTKESKVFHSEAFVDRALPSLEKFYKERGGNVLIMAFEGVFGICSFINPIFRTQWTVKLFENGFAEPTTRGFHFLGPNIPKSVEVKNNPYFIEAPEEEGFYRRTLTSKENYIKAFHAEDETFERLGITPTEGMDCFNVEKSWQNYLKRNSNRYLICLHQGTLPSEGSVVWYGDRGHSDGMSFVFCKFLNIGAPAYGVIDDNNLQLVEDGNRIWNLRHQRLPSKMTIVSILAIILAIIMKLQGYSLE